MTYSQFKMFYPEHIRFWSIYTTQKVGKNAQEILEAMPIWKKQFLSGYDLPESAPDDYWA